MFNSIFGVAYRNLLIGNLLIVFMIWIESRSANRHFMKLDYSGIRDEDNFVLTDFTCEPSLELLGRNDLYKILWCRSERSSVILDGYQCELKRNQLIFCTPLNIIEMPSKEEGFISFVFNKEFFCIQTHDDQVSCNGFLFFGSSEPPIITLNGDQLRQYETMLEMFKSDLLIKDHLQGEMLRSSLKRLLIVSTRMIKNGLPEPTISHTQMNIIRDYNILVEKHFREYHHVKDYANLLFKSPKTLSNLFPKYSDKSPLMVINDRILLEAKRLLLYSDQSAIEIAEELGYKDASHFSKFFKKHVGMSPTIFRKSRSVAA